MRSDDQVFGQFLLDAGLLSRSQLETLQESKAPLSKTLIDLGVMGEDEVRRAQAHALGVPFVVIDPFDIELGALTLIAEPLSRTHGIVAFAQSGESVSVAVLDLADLEALRPLEEQGHFGGRRVVPHLTTRESIKRALLKYQKHLKEKFGELLADGRHVAEALISHALYSRAGGAHITISTHGALIRYQLGHTLHEAMRLPEQVGHSLAEQLKAFAKLLPVARPQEGKFKLEKDGNVVHVHVSTVPTVGGERLHVRLARAADGARGHTLESLGFHGAGLDAVRACLARRRGMVRVVGPQGSGVSTLLYTLLDLLQHPGISIATVEEKVEHRLPHAAQTEVALSNASPDAGGAGRVSMAAALRAALKQHPDVLMVGEVRDMETAALIVAAAARGIFVLAGTTSEELLPEASLSVRLALVRRLATNQFGHTNKLSRAEADRLEPYADFIKVFEALKEENILDAGVAWKDIGFARPVASTEHPDGYQGRIGLQEVAYPGYNTLNIVEDGLFKAAQGVTSLEEVLALVS